MFYIPEPVKSFLVSGTNHSPMCCSLQTTYKKHKDNRGFHFLNFAAISASPNFLVFNISIAAIYSWLMEIYEPIGTICLARYI
jgi:hypothetical protein